MSETVKASEFDQAKLDAMYAEFVKIGYSQHESWILLERTEDYAWQYSVDLESAKKKMIEFHKVGFFPA